MYGVSKINIEPSLMMISVQDVEFKGNSLARYLQIFADNGVVVDMISQSAPHGTTIDFSFTAAGSDLPLVMKAISAANLDKDAKASPLISVGYSKLNLFGEDMVTSCGVAARALNALAMAGIEVLSSESTEAVTAAAVGIAAAILAWNRWITADSMLFGLLLAGLIGLAVAGVVFLVCKVFSYYWKKRHPEAPVVSFFSSEGGMLIASPLEGKLLPLDGIEDPVFSAEVLGKGCAIEPDKGEIYAPADGVILKIAESSHAVSLRCDSGVDLLIHVGMDTVERHGAGFAPQVRAGEHVHSGQLLLKFDLQKIRADGYPLTTPVVVTNSDAFSDVTVVASGNVTEGQNILLLR